MHEALGPLPSAIETRCGDARGVCLIPALQRWKPDYSEGAEPRSCLWSSCCDVATSDIALTHLMLELRSEETHEGDSESQKMETSSLGALCCFT